MLHVEPERIELTGHVETQAPFSILFVPAQVVQVFSSVHSLQRSPQLWHVLVAESSKNVVPQSVTQVLFARKLGELQAVQFVADTSQSPQGDVHAKQDFTSVTAFSVS